MGKGPGAHRLDVKAAVGVVREEVANGFSMDLHNAHCQPRVPSLAALLSHPVSSTSTTYHPHRHHT